MAQKIIRATVPRAAQRKRDCGCGTALQYAIITDRTRIPPQVQQDLAPIIGKYIF
jgi:5'-methylthioadenosine phosphorylase